MWLLPVGFVCSPSVILQPWSVGACLDAARLVANQHPHKAHLGSPGAPVAAQEELCVADKL